MAPLPTCYGHVLDGRSGIVQGGRATAAAPAPLGSGLPRTPGSCRIAGVGRCRRPYRERHSHMTNDTRDPRNGEQGRPLHSARAETPPDFDSHWPLAPEQVTPAALSRHCAEHAVKLRGLERLEGGVRNYSAAAQRFECIAEHLDRLPTQVGLLTAQVDRLTAELRARTADAARLADELDEWRVHAGELAERLQD